MIVYHARAWPEGKMVYVAINPSMGVIIIPM